MAGTSVRALPRVLKYFDLSVLASASMGPPYSLASTMGPMVAAAGALAPLSLLLELFCNTEISAGDFHFMRQFMRDDLTKKTVRTNTVTERPAR